MEDLGNPIPHQIRVLNDLDLPILVGAEDENRQTYINTHHIFKIKISMETETKETLSRFKKYLEKEGLTQRTFAEKYGIKPSYISAIFVERRGISAGLMKSMMQAGEGPALTWILTGHTDEIENLKSELRDCRTLITSLERVISNSMKG